MPSALEGARGAIAVTLAALAAFKVLLIFAPPLGDEAYYWMWGQQLDWSYHDHPPLNALLLRLSNELFGWNRFALRAPGLLTFAISWAVLAWWAERLSAGAERDLRLWTIAAVAASPLFFVYQTIALPDHLLIALLLVAVHFFVLFAESAENNRPCWPFLHAAAFSLGLAALAKYSAVFVGVAFVAWFLFTPSGRGQMRSPHVWLAGAMAVAMQGPVMWWNFENDMASYRFHLGGRFFGAREIGAFAGRLASFVALAVFLISPFLLPGLFRLLFRPSTGDIGRFRAVALPGFAVSLAVFAGFALVTQIYFYWLIAALSLYLPLTAVLARRRALNANLAYGTVVCGALTAHLSFMPLPSLVGVKSAEDVNFGLGDVARQIEAEVQRHDADLLLTSQYSLAALLGFELKRTDIYSYSERPEQYDFWFDPADHVGSDAILVSDGPIDPSQRDIFEKIEQVGSVTARRFGRPIHTYTLYLGTGMRPQPICCNAIGRAS